MTLPEASGAAAGAGREVQGPQARSQAAVAIADLSARLGVPAEQIKVVEVLEVTWPDASLGCPQPGMMYAQVIVEGLKVVLEANGRTYAYHGRSPNDLFLCGPEGPMPAAPPARRPAGQGFDAEAQPVVDAVVADMAQQLGLKAEQIEVASVQRKQWPTSGLGCEKPGEMYLQVITPGYQITLKAGDAVFTYHTDRQGRFVLCSKAGR
ncbi:MAG: hypothetical protein NZ528_05105 [Caldilineales bacterium]|nr:hypothetical protein [Caldilineales bacterium]MDW8316238.1 hypothetical protein [Anaerolineae bacterium]